MGGGSHLLNVCNSSHAYQMKRLTAYIPISIMRYSKSTEGKKFHDGVAEEKEEQYHVREERAPSTAQLFMKVAEEKNIREGSTNPDQKQKARDDDDDDSDQQTTTTSDSDEKEKVDDLLPATGNIGPTS